MKRTPQDPRAFPVMLGEVLERAYGEGTFSIECSTDTEAQSLKFQLNRYFKALQHHMPDSPLAGKSWVIEQRVKGNLLQLVRRDQDPRLGNIEKALRTQKQDQKKVDPVAATLHGWEEEFEDLRKQVAEGKLPPPGEPDDE